MKEIQRNFVSGKLILKIIDKIVIAEFIGQFDFFDYSLLAEYLDELAGKYMTIILDMNKVERLSSTALGVFVAFRKKHDKKLRLVCGKKSTVCTILEMVKLDSFFHIYYTVADALTAGKLIGAEESGKKMNCEET